MFFSLLTNKIVLRFSQISVLRPLLFTLYTTPLSSLIHRHKLNHYLYAGNTQVFISLSTADIDLSFKQLGDCLSYISGWMINNKLRHNANKTNFIITCTSRQRSKLTHFFPTNIFNHSITPSDTVRNIGVTFNRNISLLLLPNSWPSPFSALYFSFSSQNYCWNTCY